MNIDSQFLPIDDQSTLLIPFCTFSTKPLNPLFSYRFLKAPETPLFVSLTTVFATEVPLLADVLLAEVSEPPLSDLVITFSLSKPATLFFAFSALSATLSNEFEPLSASSVKFSAELAAAEMLFAVSSPPQLNSFESAFIAPLAYSVSFAIADDSFCTMLVATCKIGLPITARS